MLVTVGERRQLWPIGQPERMLGQPVVSLTPSLKAADSLAWSVWSGSYENLT